jgi:adenine/guanine/hypoxanthine permease
VSSARARKAGRPPAPRKATEALAGITTFFTMAYIVVVNPAILSTEGTGMPFSGVMTATVLLAFSMTLLMGLYARLPFGVAPGMGINAFFTFTLVLGQKIPWTQALGLVFWAGVIFLAISVTSLRETIARAIPSSLRAAAAAGIGIFLTFIGLKAAGLVASDPVTFVKLGTLDRRTALALLGLLFCAWAFQRRNPFAFLGSIALVTGAAAALGMVSVPESLVSAPDFSSVLLKADLLGSLKLAFLPAILAILFTDLFDSISTFVGVAHAAGLTDQEGHPQRLREGLIVDALATLGAGLLGTSSGTAFIESAAGIEAGGRTGFTSVVTALCFLPCLFLAPLAGMVPAYATAPVLIFVGALMFRSVARISFDRIEDTLPAFLTVILIPLTFSITQGILWGFLAHVALYALSGRRKELHPLMYGLAGISGGMLFLL